MLTLKHVVWNLRLEGLAWSSWTDLFYPDCTLSALDPNLACSYLSSQPFQHAALLNLLSLPLTFSALCHAQNWCGRPGAPCVDGVHLPSMPTDPPPISRTPAESSVASVASVFAHALQSAVSYGDSVGIAAGTPNPALPDPCGPPVQIPAAANSISTCTKNVSVSDLSAHSYYGVNCWNDTTKPALDLSSCSDAIHTICNHISTGGELYNKTDKWIWTSSGEGCTFGYWLPAGGAPAPSFDRCVDQIYSPMKDKCAAPVGSVNIASGGLPDGLVGGNVGTGVPVRGEYPSYVMLPLESFFGINGEGT